MKVEIDLAKPSDAETIQKLHHAAVKKTAEGFYSPDILDAWAKPNTEDAIKSIRKAIEDKNEFLIVAKLDEKIAGFGAIVPSKNELRAVYVDPRYGRLGIGTKILHYLEKIAIDNNTKKLNLSASLNAEDFYAKNGYKVVNRTFHTLSSGVKMKCVNMEKILDSKGTSLKSE